MLIFAGKRGFCGFFHSDVIDLWSIRQFHAGSSFAGFAIKNKGRWDADFCFLPLPALKSGDFNLDCWSDAVIGSNDHALFVFVGVYAESLVGGVSSGA